MGLLACKCMKWEVGGIVIGGVSEVVVVEKTAGRY